MPRATFTAADLRRAARVARDEGMAVEVRRDGTIRLLPLAPEPAHRGPTPEEAESACDEIFGMGGSG